MSEIYTRTLRTLLLDMCLSTLHIVWPSANCNNLLYTHYPFSADSMATHGPHPSFASHGRPAASPHNLLVAKCSESRTVGPFHEPFATALFLSSLHGCTLNLGMTPLLASLLLRTLGWKIASQNGLPKSDLYLITWGSVVSFESLSLKGALLHSLLLLLFGNPMKSIWPRSRLKIEPAPAVRFHKPGPTARSIPLLLHPPTAARDGRGADTCCVLGHMAARLIT